jgi:hypothetical protein
MFIEMDESYFPDYRKKESGDGWLGIGICKGTGQKCDRIVAVSTELLLIAESKEGY